MIKILAMKVIMFLLILAIAIAFIVMIPFIGLIYLVARPAGIKMKSNDDLMTGEYNYGQEIEKDGIKWGDGWW